MGLTEEQAHAASIIHRSGNDLLALINEILDLAKIEAGRMEIIQSQFSLNTMVDNILEGQLKLLSQFEARYLAPEIHRLKNKVRGEAFIETNLIKTLHRRRHPAVGRFKCSWCELCH